MSTSSVLAAESIDVGYGTVPVVRGVTLHVDPGEVVVLLGPNGAGKSTTVKALSGALPLMAGVTRWKGEESKAPLHRRAREGLAYIPEERAIISKLSVADNLRLGMGPVDDALAIFPHLAQMRSRRAGLISGGEQRMLVLARALAARPDVVLADELSLGLAPLIVRQLLGTLRRVAGEGAGVLLVEQHARQALDVADRAYVLQRGSLVWQGTAADARSHIDELESAYLGH